VVRRQALLRDHRPQHVVVAQTGVVGPAVADEVHPAVLGDDAVAQRARQARVALAAQLDSLRTALADRVMDHHAVHRPPGALVVGVVVAPVADLDGRQTLRLESAQERARGHGWGHDRPPSHCGTAAGRGRLVPVLYLYGGTGTFRSVSVRADPGTVRPPRTRETESPWMPRRRVIHSRSFG